MLSQTRSRSRDLIVPVYAVGSDAAYPISCANRTESVTQQNLLDYQGSFETMTDVVVPGFHRKVKAGQLFFNPMEKKIVTNTRGSGTGRYITTKADVCTNPSIKGHTRVDREHFARLVRYSQGLLGVRALSDSVGIISANEISSAVREASTKVASERGRGSSNLYESLAEYRQTMETGTSIAESLSKVVSKIPLDKIKGVASAYLLYRYGIRPLISDLLQVKQALDTLAERIRQTTRAVVSFEEFSSSYTSNIYAYTDGSSLTAHVNTSHAVSVRAFSLDEFLTSKSYEAGLSIKNLLTVPWELIPMSFVADWFVNFGEYIGSQVPTPGVQQLGSGVVVNEQIVNAYYPGVEVPPSTHVLTRSASGNFVTTCDYTRRIVSLGSPGMVIRIDFRFDRPTRFLDALALIAIKLRGPSVRKVKNSSATRQIRK